MSPGDPGKAVPTQPAGSVAAAPPVAPELVVSVAAIPAPRDCREPFLNSAAAALLRGQVQGETLGLKGLRGLRRQHPSGNIVVRGGDFTGADLRNARLEGICFVDVKLARSDWRGARADRTTFLWSDLSAANLRGVAMKEVLFYHSDLEKADARGADWSGGAMSGSELRSWDGLRLDRARLRRFRFLCSEEYPCFGWSKSGISLRGADLTGADLSSYWARTDWTGARFDRTSVGLRQLLEIGSARFAGPVLVVEGKAKARLAPRDYAWLRRHVSDVAYRLPATGRGARPPLRIGETGFYVEPSLRFDPAARQSRLYRRLLPAIVSAASSVVQVTARRDGTLAADGNAVGSAGHVCGLATQGLRFDRGTGWFLATPRLEDGARPAPLLRFEGNGAEVREQGHEPHFALCGARAGFGRMERIAVAREEGLRMFAQRADRWGFAAP